MPADAPPGRHLEASAGFEAWGKTGVPGRGVIAHYREWLPVTERTPVVTLGEGDTPLVAARRLGEELGVELYLKLEGLNPTASFKDRGMTMAISKVAEEGIGAIICASTGNTSASAAAYAAKASMRARRRHPGARSPWASSPRRSPAAPRDLDPGQLRRRPRYRA
jgi:threonine synthase